MHRQHAVQRRPHRRGSVAVGLATGLLISLVALFAAVPPAAATVATPDLTTDNGTAALFAGTDLSPGRATENCVVLSYRNLPAGSNGLGMYAAVAGTGLADYLDLTIDVGSGGAFGDCSGFAGGNVYRGSLAAFSQDHATAASQLLLASVDTDRGAVTVRLQLKMHNNNRAQGRSAWASFSWTVGAVTVQPTPLPVVPSQPVSQQPSSQPPSPQPSPPSTPAPTAALDPVPSSEPTAIDTSAGPENSPPIAAGGGTDTSVSPAVEGSIESAGPQQPGGPALPPPHVVPVGPPLRSVTTPLLPAKSGSVVAPPGQGAAGSSRSEGSSQGNPTGAAPGQAAPVPIRAIPSPAAQLRQAISEIVSAAQEAAPAAAKGGALGLVTLPFLLLFLLIQKRLDERDPKLALAPSYQDEYLSFDDLPTSMPTQGTA